MRLVRRPQPVPYESLDSWLMRLAKANHHPNTRWVVSLAGGTSATYAIPDDALLAGLAKVTGQPLAVVKGLTLHRFSPILNPDGEPTDQLTDAAVVRFVHHPRGGMRFCPACLQRRPVRNILWQLRPVTACLEHDALLVERCSHCGEAISRGHFWRGECACGMSLVNMKMKRIHRSSWGWRAQELLQKVLLGQPDPRIKIDAPTWFGMLDFFQKWFSLFPAGVLQIDTFTTAHRPKDVPKLWWPIEIDHVHYTLAVKVLLGGQKEFNNICRLWVEHQEHQERFETGFHRHFHQVVELLRDYPESKFPLLHTWLEAFVAAEWDGGYATQVQRFKATPQNVPLHEAAAVLGTCKEQVIAMLLSGYLRGRILPLGVAGHVRALVNRSSLERARKRRAEAIPIGEAAVRLGIAETDLLRLYLDGRLPAERGPQTDGTSMIAFHPDALRDWQAGATPITPDSQDTPDKKALGPLPLAEVAKQLNVTSEVVKRLIEAGFLAYDGDLVRSWQEFQQTYVWHYEAAFILQITHKALRDWVVWGRLRPVFAVGSALLFHRSDMERFLPNNRCSAAEAADLLGCARQDVKRKYVDKGLLVPIAGPGVDEGKEFLFARSDVMELAQWIGATPQADVSVAQPTEREGPMVSSAEAAEILGVTVGVFHRKFRQKGLISPCHREPKSRKDYYWMSDVLALKEYEAQIRTLQDDPDMLSGREAAELLGISETQFYRKYFRTGRIQPALARQRGRGARFRRQDVIALREKAS